MPATTECRAIALRQSATEGKSATSPRMSAPFLAQLIATAQQMPQTRERRRAEPADAIEIYRAVRKAALPRAQ